MIFFDEFSDVNWNKLEEYLKRRSGEMANTEDLKSSEETPLAGSSPASGISNEALKELRRAHEALLNTLAPSNSNWIKQVHKNAKAYYETLKERYKWT